MYCYNAKKKLSKILVKLIFLLLTILCTLYISPIWLGGNLINIVKVISQHHPNMLHLISCGDDSVRTRWCLPIMLLIKCENMHFIAVIIVVLVIGCNNQPRKQEECFALDVEFSLLAATGGVVWTEEKFRSPTTTDRHQNRSINVNFGGE